MIMVNQKMIGRATIKPIFLSLANKNEEILSGCFLSIYIFHYQSVFTIIVQQHETGLTFKKHSKKECCQFFEKSFLNKIYFLRQLHRKVEN